MYMEDLTFFYGGITFYNNFSFNRIIYIQIYQI